MASNSAFSSNSSNLIVLREPWNLTASDLHSFLSLSRRGVSGKTERNWQATTDLSKIFLSCALCFFSSAFVDEVDGPAGDGAIAPVRFAAVLARLAGGGRDDNSSSSCARKNELRELCEHVGVNNELE